MVRCLMDAHAAWAGYTDNMERTERVAFGAVKVDLVTLSVSEDDCTD